MAAEVGLAAFSAIVSEGAKTLFEPIMRHMSYVFKYQSYTDGLKDQVKQLGHKREMVQQPVNHARLQGDEIYEGVTDWLNSVDQFSEGVAKSITDDEERAKKSCFKGLCPNLISRYKLSKQAAKAAEAAANLAGNGNFTNVSYRPAPKSTEHVQVKDFEAFDSRMKVFQDVMESLKDDKLNIIGVYGMGGVGKTTLVKQVAKQVREDKLFDKVVMAEVTQTPDHHKIQDKLAFDLGMNFELNESMFRRASRLCERLKKEKRILIILDNIWTTLELDAVGIPSGNVDEKDRKDDRRRCTIILTSRSQDLLQSDMKSQKNFSIEILKNKEALQLFEKIVGASTKTSAFQPITDEIVRRCGGLPVAVSTVANALKNKRLAIWKDALNQLRSSNPREIHGMDANVYSSIELSYKFLESDEAKSLFLLCGLYGQGHSLKVHSLLRIGMGLGLFQNVYTLEAARNRVDTLIDSLKSSCLLLDGYTEDEAKMHDIIHVVAVSIASVELMFNIPNAAHFKEEIEKTIEKEPTAISLPLNIRHDYELPELSECPKLKLLLLFAKYGSSLLIPDLFFEGMKQLKVLHFTNARIPSLPSSLGCLINVQTLCLDDCRLNDITMVGQLSKLDILSFRDSDIERLPLEIGQLTRLRLLDLSNCWRLKVIAPTVISKLSRLEELYMGNSFKRWEKVEGGSNASLVELKELSKLTTLEINVQDAEIMPQQHLVSVELERYKIFIGNVRGCSRQSGTSRLMKLVGLEKSTLLGNCGMKVLLKRTEDLYLQDLKDFVIQEFDEAEVFSQLKHLHLEYCSMRLLIGRVSCKVFPLLESISLSHLRNLETICDSQLTEDQLFSNLRTIKLWFCDKLKHLFSFSMAKNLLRLQKVEVRYCENLEMIVGPDMEKPTTTLEFKEIIAKDDPAQKVTFPSLEELELKRLETIEKLWPNQFQGMSCCRNLTKVSVEECDCLMFMFSYSMVNSLVQLQQLSILDCESMEWVVDTTGLQRDEGQLIKMVFPKLHYLHLSKLPELTSFAMGDFQSVVEFPSLLKLEIENCDNLRRFISMCSSEDNNHIDMQPQPLFDEKVRLPSLEVLRVSCMNDLRKIWNHQIASDSLSKLKDLQIYRCNNLMKNIFPSMVVTPSSLVNLNISDCEKIEEIIGHAGEEVMEIRIAFSELKLLKLSYLPRITSFCLENYMLELPSLERVSVINCPNMKTFSQGVLCTPKLCKVQVTKEEEELLHWEGILNSTLQMLFEEMGVLCRPKPSKVKVQVTEKEEDELCHWEGNLNSTMRKCYEEMVGFRDIKKLKLSHFPRIREIWHGQALHVSFFNNLEWLLVDDCTNMSSAIPANLLWCLNNLKCLEVRNCDSLEEVLHLEELNADEHLGPLLPKLFGLKLVDLPKLKRFCNFSGNKIKLHGLSYLNIENCPNMETFVSNSTSVLHVTTNKEPQEITSEENFLLADIQPFFDEKVAFPYLYTLKLSRLPKVLHLWKENIEYNKVLPNLVNLEISECCKLQKLVPSWMHLENLTTLEVSKCHGLINLSTLSTSESLVFLARMKIADCCMIEEIIHLPVGEEEKNWIVFSRLEYLGLDCLPSLTRFCSGNYTIEFPCLHQVLVRQCPKMKIFSQGVLRTPWLKKVQLTEEEDDDWLNKMLLTEEEDDDDEGCWEGNLNDTIKKLFHEVNSKDED